MKIGIVIPHKKSYKLKTIYPMIESAGDSIIKSNIDNYKNLVGDFYLHKGLHTITSSANHIECFNFAKESGKPILILDAHILRNLPIFNNWIRLSWNSFYFDEGIHPYDPTYNRWKFLSEKYGIRLENWQRRGENILINLQKSTDGALNRLNFNNVGYNSYILETIKKIKSISDRPIIIRPHPLDHDSKDFLTSKLDNTIKFSNNFNLYDDLNNSWCMITYNSTSSVESVLYGIPTIVLDSSAPAWDVSGHSIYDIEKDLFFDRVDWCNKISFMQWHLEELNNPYVWKLIKESYFKL